jgi:hypothetical protein
MSGFYPMVSTTLFFLLIQILFSILIVYSAHSCWNYLKDNYSTKKTKDIVNIQIEKYKKIMDELAVSKPAQSAQSAQPFLNEIEKQSVYDDLAQFVETNIYTDEHLSSHTLCAS